MSFSGTHPALGECMVTRLSTLSWSLIVLSVTVAGCRREQQAGAARQPQPGVLYYGATATGHAWLVYVDFELREGVRYAPSRNLGLCDVRRDSAGTVSWLSGGGGDVERFQGKPTSTGLHGGDTVINVATGKIRWTNEVTLDSMSLPDASADTISDLYSTVNYVERAGDLTGAELLFLRVGSDSRVLITMYEGTPDGPWVMTDVHWTGDTLSGAYGSPPRFASASSATGATYATAGPTSSRNKVGASGACCSRDVTRPVKVRADPRTR
jgi:hypothetical protein